MAANVKEKPENCWQFVSQKLRQRELFFVIFTLPISVIECCDEPFST
jgi:anaerobic ribonucleoside-triphosphate reductase